MREQILNQVLDYCIDTLLVDDVTPESKIRDIGLDSLDIAELSVELERKFHVSNVKIDLDITDTTTINHVVDYFNSQINVKV